MARQRTTAPKPGPELIPKLLEKLNVMEWDLLIIGDGSGSGWNGGAGWASCMVDRQTQARRFFYGGMNAGSVNFAEIMPYMHALNWFDSQFGKGRLKQSGVLRTHIVTDSSTVATWGNRVGSPAYSTPRRHAILWGGIQELVRLGYTLEFHWAPRMTTQMNWASDILAGLGRTSMRDINERERLANEAARVIDDLQLFDPETEQPLDIYTLDKFE